MLHERISSLNRSMKKDPSDKWRMMCDDKLKELSEVDPFNGFSVPKLLTAHFIKTGQNDAEV